ncbi:MAG: hypothetical protein HFJ12_03625 [Bacilli bacterium]|nr:hypothetical protein [Bacilli bacterium]
MDEKIKTDNNMNQDIKSAINYINNNDDGFINGIDLYEEFREGADPTGEAAFSTIDKETGIEELSISDDSEIKNEIQENDDVLDIDDLFE